MNLHHLAIFHAIAETGSISAAAVRVRISQPALSRELKDFESRLGVTLFERQPRGMRLTESGKVLQAYAVRLFAIAQSAEAAMRDMAEARAGHLLIGASNTIGTYLLPRHVAGFRKAFPEVRISIFVGNTEQVSQGVADLRFALGFVEGPVHVGGLSVEKFGEDVLIPVVSAEHPLAGRRRLSPGDIDAMPLLMREPGSGTRELVVEMLDRLGVAHGNIVEFGNTEALKQAAAHGGGIAWLPRISVERELGDKSLLQLRVPALAMRRSLSFVRRAAAYEAPVVEAFLRIIRATHAGTRR